MKRWPSMIRLQRYFIISSRYSTCLDKSETREAANDNLTFGHDEKSDGSELIEMKMKLCKAFSDSNPIEITAQRDDGITFMRRENVNIVPRPLFIAQRNRIGPLPLTTISHFDFFDILSLIPASAATIYHSRWMRENSFENIIHNKR